MSHTAQLSVGGLSLCTRGISGMLLKLIKSMAICYFASR